MASTYSRGGPCRLLTGRVAELGSLLGKQLENVGESRLESQLEKNLLARLRGVLPGLFATTRFEESQPLEVGVHPPPVEVPLQP